MLILAEKPSVAKEFSSALGASSKKGYYEGNDVVITYCVGHLFELLPPEGYDPKYNKWSLGDLPIIPGEFQYQKTDSVKDQADVVTGLLKRHANDDVLIATDAGREGELIARIAILMAGISITGRFKRFWVSEALTLDVILSGIKNAKPLSDYDSLSAQGFARQRADWLVGINLSRYMSIGNPPPTFSVGRVQTAVLSSIAARNEEVKNFIPVPYKELQASIISSGQTINALLENPNDGKTSFHRNNEEYLIAAKAYCANKNIDNVESESKQKINKPEKLLNITGLQKAAFKKFGFSPEETLSIAQALYEVHKCLSYPRTPSRVMGDNNVDLFREKFELLKDDYVYSSLCDPSLINAGNKHIFNSAQLEDHHALIPLASIPANANEKERSVYSIVLESFFSVCMPDFIYNEKSLRFIIGAYSFVSKIREIIQPGFKEAKQKDSSDDNEDDVKEISGFDENNCKVSSLSILEKKTSPKKEFAIDTLLAFMEHPKGESESKLAGLGTPATRAEIIKTLFSREYLSEQKKKLYATDRGRFLLQQLSRNEYLAKMADVSNTTDWEERLLSDPEVFEKDIVQYISLCVKVDPGRVVYQNKPIGTCPLCKKPVFDSKLSYSCSGYKDEPKCAFSIWKTIAGATVTPEDAALLLIGQKTKLKKCKNKEGKQFDAHFALEGGKVVFKFKN